jgi:ribosome biogenesis GTPase
VTASLLDLTELGWDDTWRELASSYPDTDAPGRVARVDKGLCTVVTEHGPIRASYGSALLDACAVDAQSGPCTGDWCLVRSWPDGPVTVEAVLERRTSVVRAAASGTSTGQVLVANVDVLVVVVALHPEPNLSRVERLVALAWESGARPVIVLTKADLVPDGAMLVEDVRAAAPSVEVIVCSTVTGQGVEDVRDLVAGSLTLGLLGASGHGKSSLTNALVGAEVLVTRQIRDDGKGRHTSVRRELVPLPGGGAVIDTPGLRGVGLQEAEGGGLASTFPDIEALVQQCRFNDCSHELEPDCAVRAAVADGTLSQRRLDSWFRLRRELVWMASRTDARLRADQVRKWKAITKHQRHQKYRS